MPQKTRTWNNAIYALLCATLLFSQTVVAENPWDAPALLDSVSIRKGQDGQRISFDEMLKEISQADAIFLGESHTDEGTHRVEWAIYEALLAQQEKQTVLAMEMFERDDQPLLDDYLAGELDEQSFRAQVQPWGNYHEAYRPLIELAKQKNAPVVGSNFPTKLRRRIAFEGPDIIQQLSEEEKKLIPKKFYPNSKAYWKRVNNVTRSHQGMMPNADDPQQLLYSTQSLWDNSMGEACADILAAQPNRQVLHINGGFHSAYGEGTVEQFKLRRPKAMVKTISIGSDVNPATFESSAIPDADYLVVVESRATNLYEGERTVSVEQSFKYRFHIPEPTEEQKAFPLLIWLSDDGLTAKESLRLWKSRLGDQVAIAVVEAPNMETQRDLALGGRWFWQQSFSEEVGRATQGVERVWAYLLRHFPIDADRVCVAGEGTGATVAACVTVHTDRLAANAVAYAPRKYSKLADLPLPLPEYFQENAIPERSLQVVVDQQSQEWWQGELQQYAKVGLENQLLMKPTEIGQAETQVDNLVRKALGIEELSQQDHLEHYFLVNEFATARSQHWCRMQAHWLNKKEKIQVLITNGQAEVPEANLISTEVLPENAMQPGVIPQCPGPFGGTTVVVLPESKSEEERQRWFALEENDPLKKASRFHRLRIATSDDERPLADVLNKLYSENRKNILIVPAVFYAEPSWLQNLSDKVAAFSDTMEIQWLPGLGGREGLLGLK